MKTVLLFALLLQKQLKQKFTFQKSFRNKTNSCCIAGHPTWRQVKHMLFMPDMPMFHYDNGFMIYYHRFIIELRNVGQR